jgi:hypothetical protein
MWVEKEKDSVHKEGVMNEKELYKRIAYLESVNDHLLTEMRELDHLLKLVGFSHGLQTVKSAATELLEKEMGEDAA